MATLPALSTRIRPALDEPGAFFWTAGARGELRVAWCSSCAQHLHPSGELCPRCLGADLSDVAVSGDATVVAFTDNHQPWLAGMPPPYVIAIVELCDAPSVRLTTNLIDCDAQDLRIGMAVQVRFVAHGEVWLPLVAPRADAALTPVRFDEVPVARTRPHHDSLRFETRVALTGIGSSTIARRLPASGLQLSVVACQRAVEDAGLSLSDIDGLSVYPSSSGLPGISDGGVRALEAVLDLQPVWHCGAHELPGQTGNLVAAMLAVAAGLCRHVLCVTSVAQRARPGAGGQAAPSQARGELAWQLPFGAATPASWIALYASHYMARFGASRETLAWIAIAARRHAARNPHALYRDPLTLDDDFRARMICSPFGLYDCDVPCDGALAVVVSDLRAARDLPRAPVRVAAVGTQMAEHQSWDQGGLLYQRNVSAPAAQLWQRTDLKPADVDVALLYDGFTFNVVSWLEALGFCAPGEAPAFVSGGRRIDLGGELPLNPHGGQLAAGRSNGYGNVHEAVRQLRAEAGAGQVKGAEVAVVSAGGGIPAGCMLLTRDY